MSRAQRQPYIAVKKERVVHCKWCGTPESERWVTLEGSAYCSNTCKSADKYFESISVTIGFPSLFFFGYLMSGYSFDLSPSSLILIVPILICCPASVGIPGIVSGRSAQREVPYMSRKIHRSIDQEVHLQLCGHCGGSLESRKGDQSVQCSYCGTINTGDMIVKKPYDDDDFV